MGRDAIIEEVRENREAYASRFNFDLQAIHQDLKQKESKSNRQIVSLPPRRIQPTDRVALSQK
jgi:hypothetical protein